MWITKLKENLICSLTGLPFFSFLCLDSKIIHFREVFSSEVEILSCFNSDFMNFPFSHHSIKSHGVFIQVFHFKLEEIKGYFILGWKLAWLATKH